jgi:hypothetical protein
MEFDENCTDCSPTLSEDGVEGGGLSDFLLFSVKSEFFELC